MFFVLCEKTPTSLLNAHLVVGKNILSYEEKLQISIVAPYNVALGFLIGLDWLLTMLLYVLLFGLFPLGLC